MKDIVHDQASVFHSAFSYEFHDTSRQNLWAVFHSAFFTLHFAFKRWIFPSIWTPAFSLRPLFGARSASAFLSSEKNKDQPARSLAAWRWWPFHTSSARPCG